MKKISIVTILVLATLVSFSFKGKIGKLFTPIADTFINKQTVGSVSTLSVAKGGYRADSALILPPYRFADTTAANWSVVSKYDGSVIKIGAALYFRNLNPNKWVLIPASTSATVSWGGITGTLTNQIDLYDTISARLRYIDTSSMLSNYNAGVGYGLTKNAKSPYVDTSKIIPYTDTLKVNGIATKTDIANSPSGTVTSVTTSLPLTVTNSTTTPNISIDSTNSVYGMTTLFQNSKKLNISDTTSMLSGYLPLTAGVSKKVTDNIYINRVNSGIILQGNTADAAVYGNGNTIRFTDNSTGLNGMSLNIVTGELTQIGMTGTLTWGGTIVGSNITVSNRGIINSGVVDDGNSVLQAYGNVKFTGTGNLTNLGTHVIGSIPALGSAADTFLVKKSGGEINYRTAAQVRSDIGAGTGSGTVTSIATNTGTGISGGTITTSGTLVNDTTNLSTRLWRQKGVDSLVGLIALKLNISDTSSMLSNRLKISDTATMLANRLKISDTSTMLSKLTLDRVLANGSVSGRSFTSGVPSFWGVTSGTATTDSILMISTAVTKKVSANSYIWNSTSGQSSVFNNTNPTTAFNNAASLYGGISTASITSGGGSQSAQYGNVGLWGQIGLGNTTSITANANSFFSGLHGDAYKRDAGNLVGTISAVSGRLLMNGSATTDKGYSFRAMTPIQEPSGSWTGTLTSGGGLYIDAIRGTTNVTSGGRLITARSIYSEGTTDTAEFAGYLKVGGTIQGTLSTAAQTNITSLGVLTSDLYINKSVPSIVYQGASVDIGTYASGNTFRITDNNTGAKGFYTDCSTGAFTTLGTGNFTIAALGTGTVYSNSGVLTNTNPSDSSLKDSIKTLTYGLKEILQLQPKTFYYRSDSAKSSLKYGFIAQDVKKVMPDMVRKINPHDEKSKLGLETDGIYVTLINAIKEQQEQIEELKARIIKLENK